jgi:putative autotransporter adhesin-like protein
VKKIVLLTLVTLFAAGCHRMHSGIAGSGKLERQKREVGSFSSISTEGAFDIEIVCQKPQSLEIEGDDNILPLISTEVSNNVLRIRSLHDYSTSEPITLKIAVPNLEGLSASGAGTLAVSGLKNDKLEIDASGAPTIKVSGETKVLDVDTSGAGKIDAHKLKATRAVVDSKGVSRVEVFAAEQLDVTIAGPSHVIYEGDPVVKRTVHGPGSIEKRESQGS